CALPHPHPPHHPHTPPPPPPHTMLGSFQRRPLHFLLMGRPGWLCSLCFHACYRTLHSPVSSRRAWLSDLPPTRARPWRGQLYFSAKAYRKFSACLLTCVLS